MRRWLLPLLALLVLLGIWQLYVLASGVSSLVLPSPIDVGRALIDDRGTLWHNLKPTAAEIMLGIALGAGVDTRHGAVDLVRRFVACAP